MKSLFVLLSLATLGGCVTAPYGPANYNARTMQRPADPNGWHTVSVTPVAPGTGARLAAASGGSAAPVETYTAAPYASTQPIYTTQPVYSPQQPIYAPAPVYYAPNPAYYAPAPYYYYPPVSLSLGFMFGHSWGRSGWGRAGFGYRHH